MLHRPCTSISIALACVLAAALETRGEPPANVTDDPPRPVATANGPVSLLSAPPPPRDRSESLPGVAASSGGGLPEHPVPIDRRADATVPPPLESRTLGGVDAVEEPDVLRASAGAATGPGIGSESDVTRSLDVVRVIGALAGVVGLILLLRLCVRRAGGGFGAARRPSGVLEVMARYPVGRGQQLLLLKVARRVLLLHQSGTAMTTLSELTEPDEVAAILSRLDAGSSRTTRAFKTALRRFENDHRVRDTTPRDASLLPGGEPRVVDLTDSPHATLRRLLDSRRVEA